MSISSFSDTDTTPEPIPTTLPPGIQSDLDCDFEIDNGDNEDDGMCGFTQAIDDILDWRRARAETVQTELGSYFRYPSHWRFVSRPSTRNRIPAGDHTLDSPDGMSFISSLVGWLVGGWVDYSWLWLFGWLVD